ncbi:hypothetical protein [Halomontanus rarus]|uniref:hypothetical protein n=1 Tax=Halomontanus rarus TaxID=3034020 RepID=UPI0023E8A36C|nr:hypothetical protein [Halovivax sp. TS33]
MSDMSTTFSSNKDRLTYLLAEGQLVAVGIVVTLGILLVWFRPSLPGIPPIVHGWMAALFLLGPPLLGLFITLFRKFRNFRWETVFHINGATDEREKWYVKPAVWKERKTEGPSPYRCNDDEAWEVREFDWQEETETLTVRGSHLSQMQDSALVTFRTLVFDLHETFVEKWMELNALRARDTKRGLEVQADVVNAQAEASERGQMQPKLSVKEAWEDSLEQVKNDDDYLEVDDLETYAEQEFASWSPEPIGPERPPETTAATDGGEDA